MAAVSAALILVSFVGVGLTYHPTPEQIAERERVAAEKAERERSKDDGKAERERIAAEKAEQGRQEAKEATHAETEAAARTEVEQDESSSATPSEFKTPKPELKPSASESNSVPVPAESTASAEYDALQQLYLDISPEMSYTEMLSLVESTGLPFSEEKYNGSRTVQVAFTEECTAQSYKKGEGDYLEIHYGYPKNENSVNDELEKYYFNTCAYNPCDSQLSLISHKSGYYFNIYEPGNYIMSHGSVLELDVGMSKAEQLEYYISNSNSEAP